MSCPDENTLLAFVEGRLDPSSAAVIAVHVDGCAPCGDVVAGAAGALISQPAAFGSDPAEPGATIGHYVILSLVGRGGMGEVYAAYDPTLDRKVAIKFLRPEVAGRAGHQQAAERMRREARAIAKLSHPNVVVVYEIGVWRDRVFIAMEYVEGETVSAWMRARPRAPAEVLRVFLAAGRGLAAAHEAGVVHRDFKPQNVMITGAGQVRVMDFGLARLEVEEAAASANEEVAGSAATSPTTAGGDSTRLTETGALLGTPAYMAPEQLRGEAATARTDQYGFCVALHEALAGQRPSPGPSPPRALGPVPSWVRPILQRGLADDPAARYASMDDLLADLGRDRSRRRRVAVAAVAAVVLAAGATWGALQARAARGVLLCRGGDARAAAVWPFAEATEGRVPSGLPQAMREAFRRTGAANADGMFARVSRLLSTYLSQWSARYTDACQATHVRGEQSRDVLALRAACLDERLAAARSVTETLLRADAQVMAHAADAVLGLPDLDRCSELVLLGAAVRPPSGEAARAEVERLRRRLAELKLLVSTGHYDTAARQIRELEGDIRRAGYQPLLVDFLLMVFVDFWPNAGVPFSHPEMIREALRAAQTSGYEEGAAAALVLMVGVEYRNAPVADLAMAQADALLEHLGEPLVLRAWLENNVSMTLMARGQMRAALEHALRSIAAKEQRAPRDDRDIGMSEGNTCLILESLGRLEEALAHCQRHVDLCMGSVGENDPQTVNAQENRAAVLAQMGRFGEACPQADRVLAYFRDLGETTDTRSALMVTLARCALADHRPAAARDLLQRALAAAVRTDATPLEVAEVEEQLARALWATGEPARALRLAESASARYAALPELADRREQMRAWLAAHRR